MGQPQLYRMAFLNSDGKYLSATQNADNTWTIESPSATPIYLPNLPKGWDNHKLTWKRDMQYGGVFNSESADFEFGDAAAAILKYFYYNGGWIQSIVWCLIEICVNESTSPGAGDFWRYEEYYKARVDFSEINIDEKNLLVRVSLIDTVVNNRLQANKGTKFNIPIWVWSPEEEVYLSGATFMEHQGLKLRWATNYETSATTSSPLDYTGSNAIIPFNAGAFGTSPNDGYHTFPAFSIKTVTQNNMSSTFIGNDILSPFLQTSNQRAELNANNNLFTNFSQNSFFLKDLLPTATTTTQIVFEFSGRFTADQVTTGDSVPRGSYSRAILAMFEVSETDGVVDISGAKQFVYIGDMTGALAPASGTNTYTGLSTISFGNTVTLNINKCYAFAILYDDFLAGGVTSSGLTPGLHDIQFQLDYLTCKASSYYDSGQTLGGVVAPYYPPSSIAGYRPLNLWQKLVEALNSTTTDPYGFPIIPGSVDFEGYSDDLDTYEGFNVLAKNVIIVSGNTLRKVNGQPCITTSVQDFFNFCRSTFGMGLGVETNVVPNRITINRYQYFYDAATLILDLDSDIADLKIYPFKDIACNNIKVGYEKINTNNEFGIDSFCVQQEYRTPITTEIRDLDCTTPYNADMYAIEKARAQQSTDSIQSPSSDNQTYIIEIDDAPVGTFKVETPNGNLAEFNKYIPRTFPFAQSTDPIPTVGIYVTGLYYPDTAINLTLTPSLNFYRNGAYIHTALHGQDGEFAQYQTQYQMLYNTNPPVAQPLPGISTKFGYAQPLITEVSDVAISDLDAKLFLPHIIEIKTALGVNVRSVINNTPYGYVRCFWQGKEYKGFIYMAEIDAKGKATTLKLLATPDMVF